jgi:hypothetical protein
MRRGDCLPDAIPTDCIGLADAFQRFVKKLFPHIENMNFETLQKASDDKSLQNAEVEFRQELRDGRICALFDGPDGVRRVTSPNDWVGENALPGFRSNFVDWQRSFALVPGPDTRVGTEKRRAPIFFDRIPFERWLVGKCQSMAVTQRDRNAGARDRILDRAQEGELTPEQAEAEARKAGIGPLEQDPPLPLFDPMQQTYWTLAMALAWVIERDPAKVRSYWNEYRRECWVWRPHENQKGWTLGREMPVSVQDVFKREAASGYPTASEALDTLWKALQAGKLVATGIPHRQKRQQISAFEWIDMSRVDYADHREEAVFSHTGELRFEAFRVAQADVETNWPAPPSSAKAATDCKAYLIKKMQASPNVRLQSDKDLFAEAKAKYPRLSERGYERAKSAAVEETGAYAWAKPGRPKAQT